MKGISIRLIRYPWLSSPTHTQIYTYARLTEAHMIVKYSSKSKTLQYTSLIQWKAAEATYLKKDSGIWRVSRSTDWDRFGYSLFLLRPGILHVPLLYDRTSEKIYDFVAQIHRRLSKMFQISKYVCINFVTKYSSELEIEMKWKKRWKKLKKPTRMYIYINAWRRWNHWA